MKLCRPKIGRPISLLSIYNRTFEKLMYVGLINFIDTNNNLYNRRMQSTLHAMLDILFSVICIFVVFLSILRRHLTLLVTIHYWLNLEIAASEK